MRTEELKNWMIDQVNQSNSVPCIVRGGGSMWCYTEEDVENFFADDDYSDNIDENFSDEDYDFASANFKSWLGDNFAGMQILKCRHLNGWNEENFDKFVCIWKD